MIQLINEQTVSKLQKHLQYLTKQEHMIHNHTKILGIWYDLVNYGMVWSSMPWYSLLVLSRFRQTVTLAMAPY